MRVSILAARQAQLLLREDKGPAPVAEADQIDPRPEMLCFRSQTLALVRHFFELSCQVGRLPSLLGREFFRARVSHHSIPSFEEQAVFSRDIELCLNRLSDDHAEIITLIGLSIPGLLSGAILEEVVFNYPGIGLATYNAALVKDYPILLGTTLVFGALTIAGNLVADIAYAYADPRVRLA